MIISEKQLDILKKLVLREVEHHMKKNPEIRLDDANPVMELNIKLHKDFFELEMFKSSPAWQEFIDRTLGMSPEFKNFLQVKREELEKKVEG